MCNGEWAVGCVCVVVGGGGGGGITAAPLNKTQGVRCGRYRSFNTVNITISFVFKDAVIMSRFPACSKH
jgi:hypothetical protein